jgi:hypothetical protein
MLVKTGLRQGVILVCSALLLVLCTTPLARAQGGTKKPSLSLKASPSVSFAPARIVVVAELKGGADDAEEFYCPTVEWEWGDGTVSTAEADCNPYEAGKSQIKRRYTVEHQFRNAGGFKISLRLKKGTKVAAMANAVVQVRAGLGPGN